MILISHRGNINGRNESHENKPHYIENALSQGFDVEVDIWINNDKLFLGHDFPETEIETSFLEERRNKLWCHAKNLPALEWLTENKFHCFFHDKDEYVLTSLGVIWAYPGSRITNQTICVMPERVSYSINELHNALGICSDIIDVFKQQKI